jgi:hypothetical protein
MSHSVSSMRRAPEGYAWSSFGEPEYTDWLDESPSWKQTCYIGDWSFLWQHRFTGPDVLATLGEITVNSFARFDVGRAPYRRTVADAGTTPPRAPRMQENRGDRVSEGRHATCAHPSLPEPSEFGSAEGRVPREGPPHSARLYG